MMELLSRQVLQATAYRGATYHTRLSAGLKATEIARTAQTRATLERPRKPLPSAPGRAPLSILQREMENTPKISREKMLPVFRPMKEADVFIILAARAPWAPRGQTALVREPRGLQPLDERPRVCAPARKQTNRPSRACPSWRKKAKTHSFHSGRDRAKNAVIWHSEAAENVCGRV